MELREVLEMCDKVAPMVAPSIPFIVTVQHPDKVGLRIYFWTPPEEKVVQFLRALDFEELCPPHLRIQGRATLCRNR